MAKALAQPGHCSMWLFQQSNQRKQWQPALVSCLPFQQKRTFHVSFRPVHVQIRHSTGLSSVARCTAAHRKKLPSPCRLGGPASQSVHWCWVGSQALEMDSSWYPLQRAGVNEVFSQHSGLALYVWGGEGTPLPVLSAGADPAPVESGRTVSGQKQTC